MGRDIMITKIKTFLKRIKAFHYLWNAFYNLYKFNCSDIGQKIQLVSDNFSE